MGMKAVLFNVHDIALIVTVIACALLGSRHIGGWRRPKRSGYLFGLFLAINALVAVNTLIVWAEPIRHPVFALLPYLYLVLGAVGFLLGPLLYWQLRSHMSPGFRLSRWQWWHLTPAVLALIYLYLECFRFPHAVQRDLLLNLQLYQQPNAYYDDFITLKKLLPLAYGLWCLAIVVRSRHEVSATIVDKDVFREQSCIVSGFTMVWLWSALTHFVGSAHSGPVSDAMGVVGNYATLALVAFLLYRELLTPLPTLTAQQSTPPASAAPIDDADVARITAAMTRDRTYLNPQLTLERFAAKVDCSPRDVSTIINRRFKQNFHDFVSRYRLEEVKRQLRDPATRNQTITDIARAAGFNSKATFHRFFKKTEGITPCAYRQKHHPDYDGLPASSRTA